MFSALGAFFFLPADFHEHYTARGARFLLGFRIYLILAETDQVYLILAFALLFFFAFFLLSIPYNV